MWASQKCCGMFHMSHLISAVVWVTQSLVTSQVPAMDQLQQPCSAVCCLWEAQKVFIHAHEFKEWALYGNHACRLSMSWCIP